MSGDLTTLSTLLGSQEARDAAPCVPVTGPWVMFRNGSMSRSGKAPEADQDDDWWRSGKAPAHIGDRSYDIIWSGDLPALLAALVAERDGLAARLARAKSLIPNAYLEAQTDRRPWSQSRARTNLQELDQ